MAQGTDAVAGGTVREHARVALRTRRLLDAVRDVTLEEFRSEDAHFERHSRLGRELLYLVANSSWCRRTTEVVDARQAQFVDTDVIVDVDLAYADHEAFEPDAGITWLPLLALPPLVRVDGVQPPGSRSRWRPGTRRRAERQREDPDPFASLEVSDASGARVHKLPRAEVHQRLAAALAEIILNVMANRSQQVEYGPGDGDVPIGSASEMERQDKLLLSAAIRRLLSDAGERPAARGGTVPAGVRQARTRLDRVLSTDVELAEAATLEARRTDLGAPQPAPGLDPYDDTDRFDDERAVTTAPPGAGHDTNGTGGTHGTAGTHGTHGTAGTVRAGATARTFGTGAVVDAEGGTGAAVEAEGGAGAAAGARPAVPVGGGPATRVRPVLGSHVGEILDALIGTTFVVVAAQDPGRPISYTIRVPSRRLIKLGNGSMRFQPRALLSIDLLAPTTHADRLIRLTLPDGVVCHDGSTGALGRIDVVLPAPFERLDTLMHRLFPASLATDRPATWVDGRIAEMALHTVDAALDSLRHYTVTATRAGQVADAPARSGRRRADAGTGPGGGRAPSVDELTADVDARLRDLREELATIRRSSSRGVRMDRLRAGWDGGSWFPTQMRRRLGVNTASTNLVMMRASAVDEISLRARPTIARIEADVSVSDSPVFNVARYAGAMNMTVLAVLAALLFWDRRGDGELQLELLATILTLFSAVQAGRVEHPDGSTLRGLLSRASYWIMLGSVLPTVLLAMALAVIPPEHCATAALIALFVQGLLTLRLRRGPLSRWRRDSPPGLILATDHAPDHARVDVLRGKRSRALVTEALLLGREAYAYVVTRPAGQDQFTGLLERTQSAGRRPDEGLGRVAARFFGRGDASSPTGGGHGGSNGGNGGAGGRGGSERRPGDGVAVQDVTSGDAVNLLGVVQSATAGRTMSYLVFRERPPTGWMDGDPDPASSVAPVPLDADRLAPMEPPEWVLEVLVGIPDSSVAIPLVRHPLLQIVTQTQRYNFRVTDVQLPAPPPPGGAGRRWMRLRIGVSYRRGDSLRGLGGFLYRLHQMDESPFAEGTLRVIVRVNAEGSPMPGMAVSRPLSDRDFDVVPDDEAAGDPYRNWRVLGMTATSRVGLMHDVLTGLCAEATSFALAGMTAATVYGHTVVFMVGRDSSPSELDRPLRETLPQRVRRSDRLLVAVDQRLTARGLDGPPVVEDRLLLRVGVRTPDRPGVLRDTLAALAAVLADHGPRGVPIDGLDVWFVLLEVVDGRTTRGRLTVRLPGPPETWPQWQAVDWTAVERSVGRAAALAARAAEPGSRAPGRWPSAELDDTVITAELLRTAVPAPLVAP